MNLFWHKNSVSVFTVLFRIKSMKCTLLVLYLVLVSTAKVINYKAKERKKDLMGLKTEWVCSRTFKFSF